MYVREVGIERLSKHAQMMTVIMADSAYKKGIHIDIPINFFAIHPPEPIDISAFNSSIPQFDLIFTQANEWLLRSYGIKNNEHFSSVAPPDSEGHCVEQAYHFGNVFVIALSMATRAFVSWRQISLPSLTFQGSSLLRNRPLQLSFPSTGASTKNTELDTLHAGYLAVAFEIFSDLLTWNQKFISSYDKAQLLLTAPSYLDLNFCEESYLNYFRCLEYLAMEKILEKHGNCDNHNLTNAMLMLDIQVNGDTSKKAISGLSNALNKQRDNAVAHLTRSNLNATRITAQEVYEIKSLVDLFSIKHIITKQINMSAKLPQSTAQR